MAERIASQSDSEENSNVAHTACPSEPVDEAVLPETKGKALEEEEHTSLHGPNERSV